MRKGFLILVFLAVISGSIIYWASPVLVWGAPLLDSTNTEVSVDALESQAIELRDAVLDLSESNAMEEVDLSGFDRVAVNTSLEYIELSRQTSEGYYPETWTFVAGSTLQNLSVGSGRYAGRRDLEGVVLARSSDCPEDCSLVFRVEFRRKMVNESVISEVDLTNRDNLSPGNIEVVFQQSNGAETRVFGQEFTLSSEEVLLK
ncbi:MAG: hypothetical protein ABEK10_02375 [Candidatus Nanosalina sp.]